MKFIVLFLMLFPGLSWAQGLSCRTSKKVMITAFEPFGGHSRNGSAMVAETLVSLNQNQNCIEYDYCLLPVEYENGSSRAIDCFKKMRVKPDLVISMGEGGCEINLETGAHNVDDTPGFPDNAGKTFNGQVIEKNAAAYELLTLPVADMFCASDIEPKEKAAPIAPSVSPGKYVCNDVAYRLGRYLKPQRIPFGFIHVPPEYCGKNLDDTAGKVNIMALTALRALSVKTSIFNKNKEVSEIPAVGKKITAACRAQVMHELRKLSHRRED